MIRALFVLSLAFIGCAEEKAPPEAPPPVEAPKPVEEPPAVEIPSPADFADEAEAEITGENYLEILGKLEAEYE